MAPARSALDIILIISCSSSAAFLLARLLCVNRFLFDVSSFDHCFVCEIALEDSVIMEIGR